MMMSILLRRHDKTFRNNPNATHFVALVLQISMGGSIHFPSGDLSARLPLSTVNCLEQARWTKLSLKFLQATLIS